MSDTKRFLAPGCENITKLEPLIDDIISYLQKYLSEEILSENVTSASMLMAQFCLSKNKLNYSLSFMNDP